MVFVFEDKREKGIPTLFRRGYPDYISDAFIYSGGNGNLKNKVIKALSNKTNIVCVFMDLVPDNINTHEIFRSLMEIENGSGVEKYSGIGANRLVVIPIPCIEYYYIKSLEYTNLNVHPESVKLCISMMPYINDSLIRSTQDRDRCKSFEKYCKFIVDRAFKNCVKDKHRLSTGENIKELYAFSECICKTELASNECKTASLIDKAINLLKEMPVIPAGSLAPDNMKEKITLDRAKEISREAVSTLNVIIKEYKKAGLVENSTPLIECKYRGDIDVTY